jgi:hypothetical protein
MNDASQKLRTAPTRRDVRASDDGTPRAIRHVWRPAAAAGHGAARRPAKVAVANGTRLAA